MKTRNGLFADVPENLWNDWHWQVANRAETVEDLKKYMTLTPDEEEGVRKTLGKLRMAVTPYYLSLIDLNDPFDPIRRWRSPARRSWSMPITRTPILCTRIPTLPPPA